MIDLKKLREMASLSQAEVAARTGLSQVQICRYEQSPEKAPLASIVTILQALGHDLASASQTRKAQEHEPLLAPGCPYEGLDQNLKLLKLYLEQAPSEYDQWADPEFTPRSILERLRRLSRRPKLVVAGAFDTGKSYLINRLLGKDLLPTGYTPMTKVATHIFHAEQKPRELHEDVVILDDGFDTDRWWDIAHIKQHEVMRGNSLTLKEFGTHAGDKEFPRAHIAIVFDDAPLLKVCSVVDTPGYMHNEEDVKVATAATREADALIYTSPAKGFMKGEDITWLDHYIGALPMPSQHDPDFPVFGNLFVVATQADPTLGADDLQTILDGGCKRLISVIGETTIRRKEEAFGVTIGTEQLRSRFYTFWSEIPDRRAELETSLRKTLVDALPKALEAWIGKEILCLKDQGQKHLTAKIEQYEITKKNLEEIAEKLTALKEQQPKFQERLGRKREQVFDFIRKRKTTADSVVKGIWDGQVNVEAVEKLIRDKFPDKKAAQQSAAQHLLSLVQDKLGRRIEGDSKKLVPLVEEYLSELQSFSFPSNGDTRVEIPFNAEGAFIGGMAGAAGIGALAIVASTMGNLGGYVLVAKGVSLLSAIGISISGGTATAMSAVAAVGGPITIAIGLGIAAILAGWALFGSWQNRLAKKIVSHFTEKNTRRAFVKSYAAFWEETESAFTKGAASAEKEYEANLEKLREMAENKEFSIEKIGRIQIVLDQARAFFANMPWKAEG